ncbi:diaminopimelate decarboxylase [Secundilactobacillus paracollinoides]|uniref:Diaminopimelate decarboxylase n=1 Tax=Secundilactobacillus paracollinoides TaxID=240427 RepID=A0A1B2IYM6_9LACO|nr:diaminopimelate decarboxylase [Secundilactobacillus paracollinoides]ANZ61229.1 diaminopimelate decarboxylase [Secundilactobacillus paracollinoides]ANZ67151.1 diaminopimelate decarboxylase [Secundilactobacillus paracollinoides]
MSEQVSNQQINDAGHLTIGGVDALKLAQQYQTPLAVYDVSKIRDQIRRFKSVFEDNGVDYAVTYASKAFATIAMYQVVDQEGAHIDVVSGGELYTALQAHFPAANISFHGNNKSYDELEMAIENHVGTIVLDNFHEIEQLSDVLEKHDASVQVMMRITPGISAHTHEYIQTGQEDSKFGFDLKTGLADKALQQVLANKRMNMIGIHAHIGSQIFELNGFQMAAEKLVDIAAEWHTKCGYQPQVINVGGGFGIRYTKDDNPLAPEAFVDAIVKTIKQSAADKGLTMPAVWIEPGRSIAGPAGYTLYTVGGRKDVDGLTSYLTVDGGMGDNIRPALYQAEYEAVLASDPFAKTTETVHLAGKYCESGDILIDQAHLPATKPGDVLAMLDTGAYGYSMASNYNRNGRPAVVFVENGKSQVVVKRESYADMTRLDQSYDPE